MGEHQERIWVTGVERYIGFDRITASSLDHSGAGEGYEYPAYVRADLYAALEADLAKEKAENARMREALEWYGEQSRLARLIYSGGDPGRHAIAADGGKRARAALR